MRRTKLRAQRLTRRFGCRSRSVGHKGKFGHEFLEFEFRPDGKLRYANKCALSPPSAPAASFSPSDSKFCLTRVPFDLRRCSSNYKNDTMIRKECFVNECVMAELKRVIEDSEVMKCAQSQPRLLRDLSLVPARAGAVRACAC